MAFDAKSLLNQLLEGGQSRLQGNTGPGGASPAGGHERGPLGEVAERLGGFGGFGGGAISGGALGLLLGNRRLRKFGGTALGYGGSAVLGALAHRAYSQWQAQQGAQSAQSEPRTLDRVPGSEANVHSMAVLKAVVGAARADGHIDARERALIETEVERIDDAPELKAWLDDQLNKPLDPADIAAAGTSGEIASEMYLASLMIVDNENYMERAYLDELARCLDLDPALKEKLDGEFEVAAREPEVSS